MIKVVRTVLTSAVITPRWACCAFCSLPDAKTQLNNATGDGGGHGNILHVCTQICLDKSACAHLRICVITKVARALATCVPPYSWRV